MGLIGGLRYKAVTMGVTGPLQITSAGWNRPDHFPPSQRRAATLP